MGAVSKTCRKCGVTSANFGRHKQMVDGYKNVCEDCRNAQRRERWAKDPLHRRKLKIENLKRFYGITIDEWEQLYSNQKGCCAICLKHVSEIKNNQLCVDHDHTTLEIRGLLCHSCNRGIGLLKDSAEVILSAFNYLNKAKKEEKVG